MNFSNPFVRSFLAGAVWYGAILVKVMPRYERSAQAGQIMVMILVFAWVVTALLVGALARSTRFRSWLAVCVSTVIGSFVVMGVMLLTAPSR